MRHGKLLFLALLACLAFPSLGWAQGFNGRARTYVSYLQVRKLVLDSVPTANVPGEGTQRTLSDGTAVSCDVDYCQYYRSGPAIDVVPVLQDLELNVWTGITGLRAYAHVRARKPLGDEVIWPRSEDRLEALSAYVEYSRSIFRIQAGRMWQTNALGFYNFDGGSLYVRLPKRLDLNLYRGISLVRGLNQPHRTDLISDVEPLAPREDAYLTGAYVRWRPLSSVAASLTYQRESTVQSGDRYSERIGGSARVLVEKATIDAEVKYDLASDQTNLARLSVTRSLPAGFRATGEVRRYVPFFELWTIWGAFSPVGYNEAQARLDWMNTTGEIAGHAYASYRKYRDTDVAAPSDYGIRDNTWILAVGGRYAIREDLIADAEYRYDEGYGASRSGGDFSVQRFFGRNRYLAAKGTAFQTFSEFRIGSGTVFGGGLQGAAPLGPATVQASAMFYKHVQHDRPNLLDLNQARLNLSLEIPIGKDPGMAERGSQ